MPVTLPQSAVVPRPAPSVIWLVLVMLFADATQAPPIELTLEYGVEFIEDDELVEITPKSVRLRKRHLTESERKKAGRGLL